MLPYTVAELSQALQGIAHQVEPEVRVTGMSTDSRQVGAGQWFVCLQGERTDGHEYAAQALAQGAEGLIVAAGRLPPELHQAPRIEVASPNQALLDWAADYRQRFTGQVLGITGSNGKTTTKEIARQLCQALDPKVHATQGNFNNFIGVPLTILAAPLESQWWVVEMGTNHFGEISALAQVVRPTLGLLTSIGESHLEFLGSTAGVAQEKSGLFEGLPAGGCAWVPENVLEREVLEHSAARLGISLKSFGFNQPNAHWNLQLREVALQEGRLLLDSPLGELETTLHNPLALQNLAGVLAALQSTDVEEVLLRQAVSKLHLDVPGRMQLRPRAEMLWINDSYNANPSSFRSVLQSVRQMYPNQRLLVAAGSMAELGPQASELHRQIGRFAADCGVTELHACGPHAEDYAAGWLAGTKRPIHTTANPGELRPILEARLQPGDVILVKGSRSARMEEILPD